jgi:hypothetical protein
MVLTIKKQALIAEGEKKANDLAQKVLAWLSSEQGKNILDEELRKVEESLKDKQDRDPSVSAETLNRRFNY